MLEERSQGYTNTDKSGIVMLSILLFIYFLQKIYKRKPIPQPILTGGSTGKTMTKLTMTTKHGPQN